MRKRIAHTPLAPAPRTRKRPPRPTTTVPAWTDRLLLHLESPDPNLLDKETAKIYTCLRESGAEVRGPIPLPVRFAGGESSPGEGTAPRLHRRAFKVLSPTEKTIALLEKLPLSGAVSALVQVEEGDTPGPWALGI